MHLFTVQMIKLRLIAPLSPHLIGRWFDSVARGRVSHSDFGQVAAVPLELMIAVPSIN